MLRAPHTSASLLWFYYKCDLEFLETCYNNGLCQSFSTSGFIPQDTLHLISIGYSSVSCLKIFFLRKVMLEFFKIKKKDHLYNQLKDSSSFIDLPYFHSFISKANVVKISSVQQTHSKKLFNLGLRCQFEKLSPDKIIFNYYNRILTTEEKEALSHGLKYGLIPPKINYSKKNSLL